MLILLLLLLFLSLLQWYFSIISLSLLFNVWFSFKCFKLGRCKAFVKLSSQKPYRKREDWMWASDERGENVVYLNFINDNGTAVVTLHQLRIMVVSFGCCRRLLCVIANQSTILMQLEIIFSVFARCRCYYFNSTSNELRHFVSARFR